jgi:hypothetical protein
VAPVVAAIAYLSAGIWIASHFATWTDEEYTLATTAHGAAYAIRRAIDYELQAPLYFAVLAVWRLVDPSVAFARLFSLLCAAAFFFALVAVGRRVAPSVNPLPFALLVATNPFVLKAAFEIRLYSLALALSAISWLTFWQAFLQAKTDVRWRVAFVASSIVSISTLYFLAFALPGYLALLVVRRARSLRAFAICAAIVVCAAIPLLLIARSQMGGYDAAGPPLQAVLRAVAVRPWLDFLFPTFSRWADIDWIHAVYHVVVCVSLALILLGIRNWDRTVLGYLACAVAIEATYLAMVLVLRLNLDARYFVTLFLPEMVAAYAIFVATIRGPQPYLALGFVPVLLSLLVAFEQNHFLAESGDWKHVAAFLDRNAGAGDAIAIYPPDALPAFERQYRGTVPVAAFPRPPSQDRYSVRALGVTSEDETRRALIALGARRHIWLVDSIRCVREMPQFGCDKVSHVATQAPQARQIQFFENRIFEIDPALLGGRPEPHA